MSVGRLIGDKEITEVHGLVTRLDQKAHWKLKNVPMKSENRLQHDDSGGQKARAASTELCLAQSADSFTRLEQEYPRGV